jgi:hypothetical protein
MNPEGKKVHCIPDPDRVSSVQNVVDQKYKQDFDKWVNNIESSHQFDAATAISSLAASLKPLDHGNYEIIPAEPVPRPSGSK